MKPAASPICRLSDVPPWRWAGSTGTAAGDASAAVLALGLPLRAEAIALLWAMRAVREAKNARRARR